MANAPRSLDRWREYFGSVNSGIFDVIKHAIMVAVSDSPREFQSKRDEIAELLFNCKLVKCGVCDRVALALPSDDDCGEEKTDAKNCKLGMEFVVNENAMDNKGDCNRDDDDHRDHDDDHPSEDNVDGISCQRYEDVEALSDEIEEETRIIDEIKKIKAIFDNNENESDSLLIDSLRGLQLMPLSVEILTHTEIGKSVNALRKKRRSEEIQNLAKSLIEEWKRMADEWVESTAAFTATEIKKEEGLLLPSPPMDEVGLLTPTSVELTKILEAMDDDGNFKFDIDINNSTKDAMQKAKPESPNNSRVHPAKIQESVQKPCKPTRLHSSTPGSGRKESPEGTDIPKQKFTSAGPMENKRPILKKETFLCKPQRPPSGTSGTGRPMPPSTAFLSSKPKPVVQPKIANQAKVHQKPDRGTVQKKPMHHPKVKISNNKGTSMGMKLEIAKRKLQERHHVEQVKRQRMT